MRTIVVGLDGSGDAGHALRWALEEAVRCGDAVRVVHAWRTPYLALSPLSGVEVGLADLEAAVRAGLEAEVAAAADRWGMPPGGVRVEVVADAPAPALVAAGADADLLVVGARGVGGLRGLLVGSTSREVVARAPCPVVVVPAIGVENRRGGSS